MSRGLIAIDIDGTLTSVRDSLPKKTAEFLTDVQKSFDIMFVTGRTFFWAMHLLEKLQFPFSLAVLNGAYIADMPGHRLVEKKYIKKEALMPVFSACSDHDLAFIFCTGPEFESKSYLCPLYTSPVLLNHIEKRKQALKENWIIVDDPTLVPVEELAALRIFSLPHTAEVIAGRVEKMSAFHAPMMSDSFDARFSVVQVTNHNASKGSSVATICQAFDKKGPVIACGDDYNDLSMLKKADVSVVMNTAPKEVLEVADIIAPSAKEEGIIVGIQKAIEALC